MGMAPLFCCFKDMSANAIAITGIVLNFLAFSFLIWGLADLHWFNKGAEVIYIISFIFLTMTLICLVLLLILYNFGNYSTNNIGKSFCLIILVLSLISFILILISTIINIKKYSDLKGWPSHDWAAVFVPSILALAACIFIALCANVLFKKFNDRNQTPNINPVIQNSTTSIPNDVQNKVVITGNNAGIGVAPPMTQNNPQFPVFVKQN